MPPAPSQTVEIRTTDAPPRGETVNVVTALVGLGEDPVRFGLGDLHPVVAGAPAGRYLESRNRVGPNTTGLDLEVRARRRQETRMVVTHVREIEIDPVRRRIHHGLS